MRVLVHTIRVLLPVLILVAIVGAVASVLSARPDLQKAKRQVDDAWTALIPHLDSHYGALALADGQLRNIQGPVHQLVTEADDAIAHWSNVRRHVAVSEQVRAANSVEAIGRRLVATATVSPRVNGNAKQALAAYAADNSITAAIASEFNADVAAYERERRGPVRRVVASVLGDGNIPAYDATSAAAA